MRNEIISRSSMLKIYIPIECIKPHLNHSKHSIFALCFLRKSQENKPEYECEKRIFVSFLPVRDYLSHAGDGMQRDVT